MKTLTAEEFRKKYGVMGETQFDVPEEDGLFSAIKKDIQKRRETNVNILNESGGGFMGDVERGTRLAANIAGGVGDVIGEGLSRIPVLGGAIQKVAGVVKGGFDAVTNKLGGTKFFQEASEGLGTNSGLERGLSVGKNLGDVSQNILATSVGSAGTGAIGKAAVRTGAKAGEAVAGAGSRALESTGKAGRYVKGAIKDITPTSESLIEHQIAKGLDITAGDLGRIESKTENRVGQWMADNNLIGTNKVSTQALVKQFFNENYKTVRSEIDKVDKVYKILPTPPKKRGLISNISIPEPIAPAGVFTPAHIEGVLKQLDSELKGTIGLEKNYAEISGLLDKLRNEGMSLADVQKVKELVDEHFDLYNRAGDPRSGRIKKGLVNVRKDLKEFIETEVKKNTGADIRQLNKNVSTAKELDKTITAREPRGITRNYLTMRDIFIGAGMYAFAGPVVGATIVISKKILSSPTARLRFARFVDKLSDAQKAKLSTMLEKGNVPSELQKAVDGQD